jgi:hypothetical protein
MQFSLASVIGESLPGVLCELPPQMIDAQHLPNHFTRSGEIFTN